MWSVLLSFALGLVLLVGGAELLVRSASRLAVMIGISPLVVGLTVVAFGTSAPELAITLQSTFNGEADIALGNVIGSNIANVLLVLGLAALIRPLTVAPQIIRLDVPIMIGVSALLLLLSLDQRISRTDGAILVSGVLLYNVFTVWQSRRASRSVQAEFAEAYPPARRSWWAAARRIGLLLFGLLLLTVGANLLVDSAVRLATVLGVSELIVGLTVIAVGTSLPEIAASVVASLRGERDIAIGNVVGSCIFNILLVLGLTSLFAPSAINVPPAAIYIDMPVMLATAVACLPIAFHRRAILRWEGALFLGYYAAYTTYLVLHTARSNIATLYNQVMLLFVIPLGVLTLLVIIVRQLHTDRHV